MQSASLDELRSRTGVLLAAASLSSAFLGATALKHHDVMFCASVAAIILFVAAIFFCLSVIWPSEDWDFAYSARTLDERYFAKGVDVSEMCRAMALGNADSRATNRERLKCRYTLFRWACGTLGSSIVIWLIDIGVR
jgi:hypothetical protein